MSGERREIGPDLARRVRLASVVLEENARLRAEVARLRLTEAERTAIQRLIEDYEQDGEPASAGVVCTLRGLLERMGGER